MTGVPVPAGIHPTQVVNVNGPQQHGHGLSAEDIQELLGGVLDDPHNGGGGSANGGESAEEGGNLSSTTDGAAADGTAPGSSTGAIPPAAKAMARSERKRSREKQRRSDVNKQFADLTEVLRRIEAELHAQEAAGNEEGGGKSGSSGIVVPRLLTSFSPTNRVDLIARTIQVLTSLEQVTKKQKLEIKSLTTDLEAAKKAGEETAAKLKEQMTTPVSMGNTGRVMMMVPMMIGGDQPPQPMMQPMMNPFMQPGAFPMPGGAAPGAAPAGTGADAATAAAAMQMPWMNQQWAMMQAMPGPGAGGAVAAAANAAAQGGAPTKPGSNSDGKPASNRSTTTGNLAHCA